jgi:hypothetical protein
MLTLRKRDNPPIKLTQIAPDEFASNGLSTIVFHPDLQGRVSALALFTQDARGVELKQLNRVHFRRCDSDCRNQAIPLIENWPTWSVSVIGM